MSSKHDLLGPSRSERFIADTDPRSLLETPPTDPCPRCSGRGVSSFTGPCPSCGGSGEGSDYRKRNSLI